ncbi:MAG: hypothetical protein II707_10245, partial [Spirochaetales bacterium]|nr:hypothetical protein [Spirochaetales bacterium]
MKNIISNLFSVLIIVVLFSLNIGCPQEGGVNMFVGVGRSVDQEDPEIWVTSPADGGYLRKADLTLSGLYKDNVGVTKVCVEMRDMSTSESIMQTKSYDGLTEGTWEITFSQKNLEDLHLFDGEGTQVYFRVTAYDAMENSGFTSLLLRVDTKAPEVFWQKPIATTRFTDADHNSFMTNPTKFHKEYSVNDPNKISYFHNGTMTLSGFVEDDYTVSSTYLKFYDGSNDLIAVTPVLQRFVLTGNTIGIAAEFSDKRPGDIYPIQIGAPAANATPMSWAYNVDTKLLPSDGWYKVVVVTEDGAGNGDAIEQVCSPEWIYVMQDADCPRNKFNIDDGVTINVRGQVSGVAFDDDCLK